MAEILDQIRIFIEQIVIHLGYPGIALVMFVENIFTPIPSELVMPFAGFLAAEGKMSFLGSVLAGTIGSVGGALVLYYVGVWADEPLVRRLIRRYGRYALVSESDLDRALAIFARYGDVIVLFGRVVPLVRSLISLPAGMNRMPLGRFLFFTALGSALWTGILGLVGLVLGENWPALLEIVRHYEKAALGLAALALLVLAAVRIRQRWLCWTRPGSCANANQ